MVVPTAGSLVLTAGVRGGRVAAFDAGAITDFSGRDAAHAGMVRGMGELVGSMANRLTGLSLTILELDVPIDLNEFAQAVQVLSEYANTLQHYTRLDARGAVCLN